MASTFSCKYHVAGKVWGEAHQLLNDVDSVCIEYKGRKAYIFINSEDGKLGVNVYGPPEPEALVTPPDVLISSFNGNGD